MPPRRRPSGWDAGICILFLTDCVSGPAVALPSVHSALSSSLRHARTCSGVRTPGMRIIITSVSAECPYRVHLRKCCFKGRHAVVAGESSSHSIRLATAGELPVLQHGEPDDTPSIRFQYVVTGNAARAGARAVLDRRMHAHQVLNRELQRDMFEVIVGGNLASVVTD